jgi:hypothetical protein
MSEQHIPGNPGLPHGHQPADPRGEILDAWREELIRAKNDPKHLYHSKADELLAKSEADYLIAGRELPRAPTPVEIAREQIESSVPDDMDAEHWDLLGRELIRMAELPDAEKRYMDASGNLAEHDEEKLYEIATAKLSDMPQSEYESRYWALLQDLGNRQFQRGSMEAKLQKSTPQILQSMGKQEHDQLVLQAMGAWEYHKLPEKLFVAATVNEPVLRQLAALGVAINRRQTMLSRLPQEPKQQARVAQDPRGPDLYAEHRRASMVKGRR